MNVEGLRLKFKIDTRTDVTTMNEETFNSLRNKVKLSHTQVRYDSPGGRINCLGQFETTTEWKDKKLKFTIKTELVKFQRECRALRSPHL